MDYFTCDNNTCTMNDNKHSLLSITNIYLQQYEPITIMMTTFSITSIMVYMSPNIGKSVVGIYMIGVIGALITAIYDTYLSNQK